MTYLAPIPKDQITTRDREFSQDRSLMRVTQEDRISLREKAAGIAKSGLYKDVNTPEKALCIMLMGCSLGVNELTALQGIYIINGRPWVSADLILALVRAKKVCKDMEAETSLAGAMCKMSRKDDGFTFTSKFGPEEAKRAGLTTKETYQKYPEQMYLHRAVRRCCTMVCPEVLMGIGVDEEGYSTNEEMNGPEGEAIALELAEGEEQLKKARAEFYAKTRPQESDWKPAAEIENRQHPVDDDQNAIDAEEEPEQPAEETRPARISGQVLSNALDYYSVLKEKKRNGPKFAEWLQKNFGTAEIEGVAEEDGQRLLVALKEAMTATDKRPSKPFSE